MRDTAVSSIVRSALAALGAALLLFGPATASASVAHTTGMVSGVKCDIWTWTDASGQPRTVALKMEGNGNAGHGGYAVQMTYYYYDVADVPSPWVKVTVNAANESDGGFGYFVSHERYRLFSDNSQDTIANKVFGVDNSPLGLGFAATAAIPLDNSSDGAESFTISYGHYGTLTPGGFNSNNGVDSPALPITQSAYKFYTIPVTTTWVFESGKDFPRIDVSVDMSKLIPSGSTTPTAGLVSFDVRGPYGVMVFDNGQGGTINTAMWGDQQYLFAPTQTPITRGSAWTWNGANHGARYNLISIGQVGAASYYEMGLYEPTPAGSSNLTDGYSAERSFTSATYAASGQTSSDQCGDAQTLPSDGEWPYQSVQYSLPCASQSAGYLTATTTGQKIAWGSASFYGFDVTSVYNGQQSFTINNFPPSPHLLNYSVCLALGTTAGAPAGNPTPKPFTVNQAGLYTAASPVPASPDCAATAAVGWPGPTTSGQSGGGDLAARVWVSGHGIDASGCGAPTNPCRSLQYAHDNAVAAGGEIDVLDPAGYGAITITKAISIVNDGVGTAGVQASSGNAITISAGANDSIYLRGLNVDGVQYAGAYGLVFGAGARLTVVGCVFRHFNQSGILLAPTSPAVAINISSTLSSDNTASGLVFNPASGAANVAAQVDHLTANDNANGVLVETSHETGKVSFAFSDIIASNNSGDGVDLTASALNLVASVDRAHLSLNGADGVAVSGGAVAHISRSVIDQNGADGIRISTTTGGTYSAGDNDVTANASNNVSAGTLVTDALK